MQQGHGMAQALFKRIAWAGQKLNISSLLIENELLTYKYQELTAGRIRVDRDNGTYESIAATAVLHCLPYPGKPYKGGIRLTDSVTPDTLRGLAIEMTAKEGVADLEFGGAKMGIRLPHPRNTYSNREILRIVEAVATFFINIDIIDPAVYVPATDIGTTSEHMDSIHTIYSTMKRTPYAGACVTSKSVQGGGLPVRTISTSVGGGVVLGEIRKYASIPTFSNSEHPRIIVQGLGQVGKHFVNLAAEQGYIVIGVSNSTGALYNEHGVDLSELPGAPDGSLSHMTGRQTSNAELLTMPCDILVPAALENQLTIDNAHLIQALMILELANHPTTEAADTILRKKGTYIIPDILGNVGGVVASGEEYAMGLSAPHHSIEMKKKDAEATDHVIQIMQAATRQVLEYAKRYDVDLRGGAWLKAIDRVAGYLQHKHRKWLQNGHAPAVDPTDRLPREAFEMIVRPDSNI